MSRANPATTHSNSGIAAWRFKLRAEIHSYEDCLAFLYGGANAWTTIERELGPQMHVERHGSYCAVRLYATEIIRYYSDGTFSVDNGGWNTPTTTARLGAVLPAEWNVWHHKKQLKLCKGYWGESPNIWPATHDVRINAESGEVVQ